MPDTVMDEIRRMDIEKDLMEAFTRTFSHMRPNEQLTITFNTGLSVSLNANDRVDWIDAMRYTD